MLYNDAQTVAILGRQPKLGIAELESLYGAENILPYGSNVCMLSLEPELIDFNRLGGSMRIARIIDILPSANWNEIEKYLLDFAPKHAENIDGKLSFGISVYGVPVNGQKVARTALLIKKAIKQGGKSVRMVPHKNTELGSATVLYNKLTAVNGWELLIISDGSTAYLAQTVQIQDIDAYSERDQARPKRDAKVGMLPPKLAQIIINLAVSKLDRLKTGDRRLENNAVTLPSILNPQSPILVFDAFCGTGVVLQEAMLMNYDVYGTDIEPRMVQYSIENLQWLDSKYPDKGDYRRIEVGDATYHKWDFSIPESRKSKVVVAGETYLGQPLSSLPNSEHLSKIIYEVNLLHHKFLENIGKQIPSGTKLCLAVPTWRGKHEFLHLPTLDHLTDIGYTRMRFKHVSNEDLIYHRENQIVGRELLILIKN
jgi:tRNA G10  N-methylase Trm11